MPENNQEIKTTTPNQKLVDVEYSKEMRESFMEYAMSVLVARALPDVRDGLKPVHRRILYTMHENGLTPDKAYRDEMRARLNGFEDKLDELRAQGMTNRQIIDQFLERARDAQQKGIKFEDDLHKKS